MRFGKELVECLSTMFLFGVLLTPVEAQQTPNVIQYQDSDGEEIFGPNYMPSSPENVGAPLYLGRPSAGFQLPDSALSLSQDVLRDGPTTWSLPTEARRLPSDIPFLRDFRSRFPQQSPQLRRDRAPPASDVDPAVSMTVHYVNVGQGAGALVELPCGLAAVDLGGEFGGFDGAEAFVSYTKSFLASHPQYNNTVDVVFVSHPHADHLAGAKNLMASGIGVAGVVDNGQTGAASGLRDQVAFRDWVAGRDRRRYSAVEVNRQVGATGVTNAVIDPFECATVTAFWGGANEKIADHEEYRNPNNHSVVVRFDFGKASFLFMGDLETRAAADMLDQYDQNPRVFDADVLQLAHHGAENGISDSLLGTVSPRIAIISMGNRHSANAIKYGHPRKKVIGILQDEPEIVSDERSSAATYWSSTGGNKPFNETVVKRAVYGTGWEGTVQVRAQANGAYEVKTLGAIQ